VLGAPVIQFVFYKSEMVGLIDVGDFNKPRACLPWCNRLELERSILNAVVERKIDESKQFNALGSDAKVTLKRHRAAKKHDLDWPFARCYRCTAVWPYKSEIARKLSQLYTGPIGVLHSPKWMT
jgi:hypothetical protein